MFKSILAAASLVLITSCGVGSEAVSTVQANEPLSEHAADKALLSCHTKGSTITLEIFGFAKKGITISDDSGTAVIRVTRSGKVTTTNVPVHSYYSKRFDLNIFSRPPEKTLHLTGIRTTGSGDRPRTFEASLEFGGDYATLICK